MRAAGLWMLAVATVGSGCSILVDPSDLMGGRDAGGDRDAGGADAGASDSGDPDAGSTDGGVDTDAGPRPRPIAIAAGREHACAVLEDGTAWCWGEGESGQIGDGGEAIRSSPSRVSTLTGLEGVTAGGDFTCAWGGGSGWCWGDNGRGQLEGASSAPFTALPTEPVRVSGVELMMAGAQHVCAFFSPGGLACWGANDHGQIGNPMAAAT